MIRAAEKRRKPLFCWPDEGNLPVARARGFPADEMHGSFARCTGVRGCSFPLAGKNQRATGGSPIEQAPWLPPDPSPLGLGAKPRAAQGYRLPRGGGLERLEVLCLLSAGGRAAPVGRPRWARVGGPLAAPAGRGVPLHIHGCAGRSFPLAGKNQRATGGSQTEPAPWLPPDPSPLGLGVKPPVARGYWLPRGGGLEGLWVLCCSSAGGRAAPVGRPRCARGGGPLAAPDGAGFLCTSADVRGVLSLSRERTKG